MTDVYAEDVKQVLERTYREPVIIAHATEGEEWVAVARSGHPMTLVVADDLKKLMRRALRRWHQESGVGAALDRLAERGCRLQYRVDGEYVRVEVEKGGFDVRVGSATPRGLSVRLELAERHLDAYEDRGFGPESWLPPLM